LKQQYKIPIKAKPRPEGFTAESTILFKKNLTSNLIKPFLKVQRIRTLLSSFYEAHITQTLKQGKDTTKRGKHRLIFLMDIHVKTINKILVNDSTKNFKYHSK
jgi:hypothetical protein